MSNHSNLVFFNKEGDALNFQYNESIQRFEGDILFHENSTDTYKTYGIYTMERIPAFEFESPGKLTLDKFQLFNEWGFHFYGGSTEEVPVINIEPVNNDSTFYSKWIYGKGFDAMFPIGTQIRFTTSIFEFVKPKRTYTVTGNKMNAILIVSDTDNRTFEDLYFSQYVNPDTFSITQNDETIYNVYISAVNCIGIYNYIDSQLQNNLSNWSEPNFYDKIYDKQKINVINTTKNNGVVTVKDSELIDAVCYEYLLPTAPKDKELIIEFNSKSELTQVYNGNITIDDKGNVGLETLVPEILKPGTEFKIVGSKLNQNFLRVSSLSDWSTITKKTYYATQSIVLYKGKMYESLIAHTQDFNDPIMAKVTPLNRTYWSPSYTIPVEGGTSAETLQNAQIYLTTDKLYFSQTYTQSSTTTFALAVQNYAEELKSLNVDLHLQNGVLKAELIYPSNYAEIKFYEKDSTNNLAITHKTNERLIEVKEKLTSELNYNKSENFLYNIVFTDIDQFGIKIYINKELYQEEATLIGTGAMIDIERSIDKTLRNWLVRHYLSLHILGIECELAYIGQGGSVFYNAIVVKSFYPNVPTNINKVEVGTTADFHIEHTRILFNGTQSIGSTINVNINGKDHIQETVWSATQQPNVSETVTKWVDTYRDELELKGIYVTAINNMIKVDIKRTDTELTIDVKNGKLVIPGQKELIITKRIKGSTGAILTSNSISLPDTTNGLVSSGFSPGMVLSINNTLYPYVNYEFKTQYVSEDRVSLSYEGPFWGLTDSLCNSSPYVTIAFNSGFGSTACVSIPSVLKGSPFNTNEFNNAAFTQYKFAGQYITESLNLKSTPGSLYMVDIKYVQLSDTMFVLGDNLIALDATKYEYTTYIPLPGNSNSSIKLEYNSYNNYLYCLSKNMVWVVDPVINILIKSIPLISDAVDIVSNPINGDFFITYDNAAKIDIYDYTNELIKTITTTGTKTGMMTWNSYTEEMFVLSNGNTLYVIDGDKLSINDTHTISGLQTDKIYYEPVYESVYFWSTTGMMRITGGVVESIPSIPNDTFKDIIYNNITGEINLSITSGFKSIDVGGTTLNINEALGGDYGYMAINQFDGNVYVTSNKAGVVLVVNSGNGWVISNQLAGSKCTKIVYNPSRKSVWTIQPSNQSVFEVFADIQTSVVLDKIDSISIEDSTYGTLSETYSKKDNLWIKTREYFRRPRENFSGDPEVEYYWEWYSDQKPEFFLYDISGNQLPTTGAYSYTGPKPLGDVPLNKLPNKDIQRRSLPEYQQTVFDRISHKLKYLDDDNVVDTENTETISDVEPLQTFLGFKSPNEGTSITSLHLYKSEKIDFSITSSISNDTIIDFRTISDNTGRWGLIKINDSSTYNFQNKGLKKGQIIRLELVDVTNTSNQYNSINTGSIFRISEIYTKSIIVDFLKPIDFIDYDSTVIQDWPNVGDTTYLKARFTIIDKEIGRFVVMAQTEDEDIRFKTNLNNQGKNIMPQDIYIFKDYDIREGGVDWSFLNNKRKEMLMHKNIIFTYIGAYKSIINAINFFGYNDLKLNEYYRNVDITSKDNGKLHKVEIPDVFDNTVVGWNEKDFIKNTMPNENFEETNLFNLTYDITDKEGNNLLTYTIEEVSLKLQGLKYWLSKNIIPLTHKIKDITGNTFFSGAVSISHTHTNVKTFKIRSNTTPISFKLTEAYLMPVNSGSTVYNCVLDFYSIIPGIGAEKALKEDGSQSIKPNTSYELNLPDQYSIKVRTWMTYQEWAPFKTYSKGDKVMYYEKLYESTINQNKLMNPKKFDGVQEWSISNVYSETNIVKYKRRFYTYIGDVNTNQLEIPPSNNSINWLEITEWIEIDMEPIQTITETRKISGTQSGKNPLTPFNFTIDSNLDPYLTIEVSTEDGYGGLYTDKKNYEIRGTKDLFQGVLPIERIGPFNPIKSLDGLSPIS